MHHRGARCVRPPRTPRVSKAPGCNQYLGTATRFRRPWSRVDYDDGHKEGLSGHELARVMVFSPVDFLDPQVWYYYFFPAIHPMNILG